MKNQAILPTGRMVDQQDTRNNSKRPAEPAIRASKRIAQRLNEAQHGCTRSENSAVDIEKFSRAMNIVFSKYMPVPEHLCALSIMNPGKSNPLAKIAQASNMADFVQGMNEMVDAIGLGQEEKTDDYRDLISAFPHNVPEIIISTMAQALKRDRLLQAELDTKQSNELYMAYNKLCHSILNYKDPTKIISSQHRTKIQTDAAQTFLKSLCSVTQINLNLKRPVDTVCYLLMISILKEDYFEFENLPDSLKSDPVFVREGIIECNWRIFTLAPAEMKTDPWFQKLANYKRGLLNLRNPHDAEDINDFHMVRAATFSRDNALEHAGSQIKDHADAMLYLIKHHGVGFVHAGTSLKANRSFVMDVVKVFPEAILDVNNEFKNDPEIVGIAFAQQKRLLKCIAKNLFSFRRLPDQFKNDRQFIEECIISLGPWVLQIPIEQQANPWLQKLADYRVGIYSLQNPQDAEDIHNIDIVRASIKFMGRFALPHLPDTTRNNPENMLRLIKEFGFGFTFAGEALQADRRFVIESVKVAPITIKDLAAHFKKDRDIVKIVVAQEGKLIQEVDKGLQGDKEIGMIAIGNYPAALKHLSLALRRDTDVVLEAVCKEPSVLQYAAANATQSDVVIEAALKRDICAIKYIHWSKRKDPRLMLEVIRVFPLALYYADDSLKNDPNFIRQAIHINPLARNYIPTEIYNTHVLVKVTSTENGETKFLRYELEPRKAPQQEPRQPS